MPTPNHGPADLLFREIRGTRQRLAFSVRAAMSEVENAKVPKDRLAELDFEKALLEEAMEILLEKPLQSPADRHAENQKAQDAKLLAKWDKEERLEREASRES